MVVKEVVRVEDSTVVFLSENLTLIDPGIKEFLVVKATLQSPID